MKRERRETKSRGRMKRRRRMKTGGITRSIIARKRPKKFERSTTKPKIYRPRLHLSGVHQHTLLGLCNDTYYMLCLGLSTASEQQNRPLCMYSAASYRSSEHHTYNGTHTPYMEMLIVIFEPLCSVISIRPDHTCSVISIRPKAWPLYWRLCPYIAQEKSSCEHSCYDYGGLQKI